MLDLHLKEAIEAGNIDAVLKFMDQGADMNKKSETNFRSPLILAVVLKNKALVKAIVTHPRFSYTFGTGHALYIALEEDMHDLVPLMLEKHTDHAIPVCSSVFYIESPLRMSVKKGYRVAATLLLEHGFRPAPNEKNDLPWFLITAINKGYRVLAETIANHPDFEARDIIMSIVRAALLSDQTRLIAPLLRKHSGIIPSINATDRYPGGMNALEKAKQLNLQEVVDLLIERGAKEGTKLNNGESAQNSPTEKAPLTPSATIDLVVKNKDNVDNFSRPMLPLYERRLKKEKPNSDKPLKPYKPLTVQTSTKLRQY